MSLKKFLPLSLFSVGALAALSTASAQTFNGNGATGFGGTAGNGMLSVTAGAGGAFNFTFTAGAAFNNDLVIYIDSVAGGGFTNTNTFTDNGDGGREAISGYSNSNGSRTSAVFAPGFGADYAISLESPSSGNYAGLFSLTAPTSSTSNFLFVDGMAPTVNGSTYSFTLTRADLGLSATAGFSFEATYISATAYRSNETIGASSTVVDPTDSTATPNAGFNGTVTFSGSDVVTVPEPGSLGCLGFGLAAVAGLAVHRRACQAVV